MMIRIVLFVCVGYLVPVALQAQDPEPAEEDPAHDELRAIRDAIMENVDTDLDAALLHVHENVVITRQDASVNRGHNGIRE